MFRMTKNLQNENKRQALYCVWVRAHESKNRPLIAVWIDPTVSQLECQGQPHCNSAGRATALGAGDSQLKIPCYQIEEDAKVEPRRPAAGVPHRFFYVAFTYWAYAEEGRM